MQGCDFYFHSVLYVIFFSAIIYLVHNLTVVRYVTDFIPDSFFLLSLLQV